MTTVDNDFELAKLIQDQISRSKHRTADDEEYKRRDAAEKEEYIRRHINLLVKPNCTDNLIEDANNYLTELLEGDSHEADALYDSLDKATIEFAIALYLHLNNLRFWIRIDSLWDKLNTKAKALGDPGLYTQILIQQAVTKSNLGDYVDAINIYDGILGIDPFNVLSEETIAEILFQKGVSLFRKGDTNYAEETLTKSLDLCKKHNLIAMGANVFIQLGNIYVEQNDFKKALDYYQKSLDYARSSAETESLSCMAYQNIGRLLVLDQKFNEAIPYIEMAIQLREQRNEQSELAHIRIDLATVYLELGKLDSAEKQLNAAFEACKSEKALDINGEILCHIANGKLLTKKGLINAAFEQWEMALKLLENYNMPKIELFLYSVYFPSLISRGKIYTSMHHIPRIFKAVKQINMKVTTIAGYILRMLIGMVKRL